MKINCNVHAASFEKNGDVGKYDDVAQLKTPLGLSGKFAFKYTYPLSHAAHFRHMVTPDMTGEDLLVLACGDYERIYREEDQAVGDPSHIPGMFNRAASHGPYGIWGHDFSDLYFEGIEIDTADRLISFSMGS